MSVSESYQSKEFAIFERGSEILGSKTYVIDTFIANGAHASVWRVHNKEDSSETFVLKVCRLFQNVQDEWIACSSSWGKMIQREARLLNSLEKHYPIVNLFESIVVKCKNHTTTFPEYFTVQAEIEEQLGMTLGQYVKTSRVTLREIKIIAKRCFEALAYLHKQNITHGDLKMGNILLGKDNKVENTKIIDLESSIINLQFYRSASHIQTRWTRSLEVFLHLTPYSTSIDMWSMGCILAELITRRPLFPCDNFIHQMALIEKRIGLIPNEMVEASPRRQKAFIEELNEGATCYKAKTTLEYHVPSLVDFLKASFEGSDDELLLLDLIKKLLEFNPEKRITAEAALQHPFLT